MADEEELRKQGMFTMMIMLTSVARAIGPSVTVSSTDFSFQNLIYLEFSAPEIILNPL
jgi:hypothetical protein